MYNMLQGLQLANSRNSHLFPFLDTEDESLSKMSNNRHEDTWKQGFQNQ